MNACEKADGETAAGFASGGWFLPASPTGRTTDNVDKRHLTPQDPKIFLGASKLLDTKLWLHGPSVLALFRALTELRALKDQKDHTRSFADKAALNSSLKTAIDRIKTNFLSATELDSCETVKP